MTTSNEPKTHVSSKEPAKMKKDGVTTSQKNPPTGRFGHAFVLGFTLLAVICALYAIYLNYHARQTADLQLKVLTDQMVLMKQEQIEIAAERDATNKRLEQSYGSLKEKQEHLATRVQDALQQAMYQKNDWLYLKARYYLELAQINAHWSDDLSSTSTLLQQANDVLAQIHDEQLFEVKQAIADEIAQINAMPRVDVAGLLSKLTAIQHLSKNLSLKNVVVGSDKQTDTQTSAQPASSTWNDRLKESAAVLEKLVVIRHHDEPIKPLPSPAQETLIRDNIILNLQAAQWAVLRNNDEVYQLSLSHVLQTIEQSFASASPTTQQLVKQLEALQLIKLQPKKPVIEQSLERLNQLIQSKKPNTTPSETDAGDKS